MKQRGLPELSVLIETKYFIDGCLLLSVKVDSNGLLSYIMIVYTFHTGKRSFRIMFMEVIPFICYK